MVNDTVLLDSIFASLAHPTRRDILQRISQRRLSVSEIASEYDMSLAAVSKHLKVLEGARLILRRRQGKEQLVEPVPVGMSEAADYIRYYEALWNQRFDNLETYVKEA